jgi:stage V sporulation protein B
VGFLFVTVAVSGVRFSVTRLLSEELGQGRGGSVGAVIRRAAHTRSSSPGRRGRALRGAEAIGTRWIGDERTVLSLRWLALSLRAVGLSNLISGYFTAVGRIWKTALEQCLQSSSSAWR